MQKNYKTEIFIEKSYGILLKYDQPYTRTQMCAMMYAIYSTVGIMQFSYDDKKSKKMLTCYYFKYLCKFTLCIVVTV